MNSTGSAYVTNSYGQQVLSPAFKAIGHFKQKRHIPCLGRMGRVVPSDEFSVDVQPGGLVHGTEM